MNGGTVDAEFAGEFRNIVAAFVESLAQIGVTVWPITSDGASMQRIRQAVRADNAPLG